jgi:hypothetical protein
MKRSTLVVSTVAIVALVTTEVAATSPRYAGGGGTVVDDVTGLEWQQAETTATAVAWKDALAHCQSLEARGQTDWRLPNVIELASIVDERKIAAPAINLVYFPGVTARAGYWTSTTARTAPSSAYVIYFNDQDNTVGRGGVGVVGKTSPMLALCVRGGI